LTQTTGDLLLQARLDVVVVRRGDVHPALLAADAARELLEVRGVGLVGADLLGRDDQVVVVRDVPPGLTEELVVDVRDQPGLELLDELLELRVRLAEGRPPLHGIGQEARARGLERPLEPLGDLDDGAPQDLGVELVRAPFDVTGDLVEHRDELVRVLEREAVAGRFLLERVDDPRLPVDEGPVDVEGDPLDVLGERHEGEGL
jgi:hypothetical protein